MTHSFNDPATEDIYHGTDSKRARKRLPSSLWRVARRKLDMIEVAFDLNDLKMPPANRLEALKGVLKGMYSIRINNQYRIIFNWSDRGAENVEIIDYH